MCIFKKKTSFEETRFFFGSLALWCTTDKNTCNSNGSFEKEKKQNFMNFAKFFLLGWGGEEGGREGGSWRCIFVCTCDHISSVCY